MELHNLKRAHGANRNRKRVGRGPGSGHGKTACRGNKGQKSRSGYSHKIGFEGGQMPLYRRLPKRGFTNIFRKEFAVVNLDVLNRLPAGTEVTPELLRATGIVKNLKDGLKILGDGTLDKKLVVKAHKFSQTALDKIAAAGGTTEVING
ncbi:MAG: 50S ribosomal protein L15 [Acidobacteria bacterium]|nr:50S ribosomal protein L15 [Acidobacteriota bacterium]